MCACLNNCCVCRRAQLTPHRFVYQNTQLFAPTSTLATGALPFPPVGRFSLVVTVVGFGFQNDSHGCNMTLTVDPLNSFTSHQPSGGITTTVESVNAQCAAFVFHVSKIRAYDRRDAGVGCQMT